MLALHGGRIAQRQHAGVDEQPAVAIFREAGEPVDVGDLDAGPLQRLDQRIGQPLRQLVQRHQPAGFVVGFQRRMPPAVAERHAAERQPRRPDRPEMREQFRQDDRRGERPILRERGEMIEQAAGARRVVAAKNLRRRQHGPAEPAQQIGAPGDALQRIVIRHLESANELGLREVGQNRCIDPQRTAGPHRELAIAEHHEACERQALGTADRFAAHRIAEAPVRPRAGIEQDADNRQIERRAGALSGRWPRHRLIDFVPVIEAVDLEMPPARMKRHVERRISRARRIDHKLRGLIETGQIDAKIRQAVAERQHLVRALAHGGGAEQRLCGRLRRHDQYFSSGLPDVFRSSALAASGV